MSAEFRRPSRSSGMEHEANAEVILIGRIEIEELEWPALSRYVDAVTRVRIQVKPREPSHFWCEVIREDSGQTQALGEFDDEELDAAEQWLEASRLPQDFVAAFSSLFEQWYSLVGYI